jgi:kynureninase
VLRGWLKARDVRDETEHDPALDLVHAHMQEVCQDLEATEIVRDYRTWEAFDRLGR